MFSLLKTHGCSCPISIYLCYIHWLLHLCSISTWKKYSHLTRSIWGKNYQLLLPELQTQHEKLISFKNCPPLHSHLSLTSTAFTRTPKLIVLRFPMTALLTTFFHTQYAIWKPRTNGKIASSDLYHYNLLFWSQPQLLLKTPMIQFQFKVELSSSNPFTETPT